MSLRISRDARALMPLSEAGFEQLRRRRFRRMVLSLCRHVVDVDGSRCLPAIELSRALYHGKHSCFEVFTRRYDAVGFKDPRVVNANGKALRLLTWSAAVRVVWQWSRTRDRLAWQPEEDAYGLTALQRGVSTRHIARVLGRGVDGTKRHLRRACGGDLQAYRQEGLTNSAQLASLMGVWPETVRAWKNAGMPGQDIGRGYRGWYLPEVAEWLLQPAQRLRRLRLKPDVRARLSEIAGGVAVEVTS